MKKIILALLTASIIISSCDILDKYPHDAVSRDSVSEEDLELLYTGLYCYSQYKPGFEGYFQNDMTAVTSSVEAVPYGRTLRHGSRTFSCRPTAGSKFLIQDIMPCFIR